MRAVKASTKEDLAAALIQCLLFGAAYLLYKLELKDLALWVLAFASYLTVLALIKNGVAAGIKRARLEEKESTEADDPAPLTTSSKSPIIQAGVTGYNEALKRKS